MGLGNENYHAIAQRCIEGFLQVPVTPWVWVPGALPRNPQRTGQGGNGPLGRPPGTIKGGGTCAPVALLPSGFAGETLTKDPLGG